MGWGSIISAFCGGMGVGGMGYLGITGEGVIEAGSIRLLYIFACASPPAEAGVAKVVSELA